MPRRLANADRDGTVSVYEVQQAPDSPVLATGVAVRVATRDDALALQRAMESTGLYAPDTVNARLRDNRRPYIVETDGAIAAYGWVALTAEPIGDLGFSFQLKPGDAYIYDCATLPPFRGRGYYPTLLRFIVADLRDQGCHSAWICTAPGNGISQRGIARAGFTKVADTHIIYQPNGSVQSVALYGVPGIAPDLLQQAAWSFHGRPYPDSGMAE